MKSNIPQESNNLVRYSRDGDAFHYRWAARRALKLISPNSGLNQIVIEGSKESQRSGEYVIDVAEYYSVVGDARETTQYFQLKHSTVRLDKPFSLSDLKDTIEGFAKRFKEIFHDEIKVKVTGFNVVTNRPISQQFKKNLQKFIHREKPTKTFVKTIKKYTGFNDQELFEFCSLLNLVDSEGDFRNQKLSLSIEVSEIVAGAVDTAQLDTLIELVASKARSHSSGELSKEEVLLRLGATSERDLFPAPPVMEMLERPIHRKQYDELLNDILVSQAPVIVHAEGGVGKSIFCQCLAEMLPVGSKSIVYDCFGSGKYRNRSQPRHRIRDAMVQISNEMATMGLCETLIQRHLDADDALLRAFLNRLQLAILEIRERSSSAVLVVFIDAADNAEIAAEEVSETCFVSQLIREDIPEGVKLVFTCRPERIHYLQASNNIKKLSLEKFSSKETLEHIEGHFSGISIADANEFHRLSAGNPRVQANAFAGGRRKFQDILEDLGLSPVSVDQQIQQQLKSAIERLEDLLPEKLKSQIQIICCGLANLPPFIPVNILSIATGISESAIRSFVNDLGRPLWLTENSVQFRDEPTETWFRENYEITSEEVSQFLINLKKIAAHSAYVAEALPALLLKAGKYNELIKLALSDKLLPEKNAIDARNVRIFRLQFAFKAALKKKDFASAVKIAMRSGEEMAGDNRQFDILKGNIDLIGRLQSSQRIQELAYKRLLWGEWDGSENVYSASLLASKLDFKEEAKGYVRSSERWLDIYIENRKTEKQEDFADKLNDQEIVELASAHHQIWGVSSLIQNIIRWTPEYVIYDTAATIVRRLVDAGEFSQIDLIVEALNTEDTIQFLCFACAIVDELWRVSKTPSVQLLAACLDILNKDDTKLPQKGDGLGGKAYILDVTSFAEACTRSGLPKNKVLVLLEKWANKAIADYEIKREYRAEKRHFLLKSKALQAVLEGKNKVDPDTLMPEDWVADQSKTHVSQDLAKARDTINKLMPWYMIRANIIIDSECECGELIKGAKKQSSNSHILYGNRLWSVSRDIMGCQLSILTLSTSQKSDELRDLIDLICESNNFRPHDLIAAFRAMNRIGSPEAIQNCFEKKIVEFIKNNNEAGPDETADYYVSLARAVLPVSQSDAAAYFNCAIEAVSKFGDELVEQWYAITSLANRYTEAAENIRCPELAYRFIRCTEQVGEAVAREKYLDRNGAVKICTNISPEVAISSLSRWRDRNIGWLDYQLPVLVNSLAEGGHIGSEVAFAMSAFSGCRQDLKLALWCLENQKDNNKKQDILDVLVRDFLMENVRQGELSSLQKIASRYSLKNRYLDQAVAHFASLPEPENENTNNNDLIANAIPPEDTIDWEVVFSDIDLCTAAGIDEAIRRFNKPPVRQKPQLFWSNFFIRVGRGDECHVLGMLSLSTGVDRYDIQNALEYIPKSWLDKISVQKFLPDLVRTVSRRFASEYARFFPEQHSPAACLDMDMLLPQVFEGVIEGLSEQGYLYSANTFFGFSHFISKYIAPEEAKDALGFSLSRLERHIEDDFGDGILADRLIPEMGTEKSIAGFIWSALGAPKSATRWEAVHCVKRLIATGCEKEIDSLLALMKKGKVEAFGSEKFPFYELHSKQFLLIALVRASLDNSAIIKKHHQAFCDIVLEDMPHVLIQGFASDIIQNIEKQFPGTISDETLVAIKGRRVSQFKPRNHKNRYENSYSSPWHENGEVLKSDGYYFAYDFDRYWFEPLAGVFGVPSQQIQDLGIYVLENIWAPVRDYRNRDDPRKNLWRDRETMHSHGSSPDAENLNFYTSYHVMLIVAQMLFENMPELKKGDWLYWLERHSLTRSDGLWLADRRDLPPLERRNWLAKKRHDDWQWQILEEDFLNGLFRTYDSEIWLNVYGGFNECDDSRNESFHITSAFVSTEVSNSLLAALTTSESAFDWRLPNYLDDDEEIQAHPFELIGWIVSPELEIQMDSRDPLAGNFQYPPMEIGSKIAKIAGLRPDAEKRYWYEDGHFSEPVMSCMLWGEEVLVDNTDRFVRKGHRVACSLSYLMKLCKKMDKELILEVQIERSVPRHYRKDDEQLRHTAPYSKVYLFDKNGILRDTTKSYQLREATC